MLKNVDTLVKGVKKAGIWGSTEWYQTHHRFIVRTRFLRSFLSIVGPHLIHAASVSST
jgi:hypothetical protein